MAIKISFSKHCIGEGREKLHLKKCICGRCLTHEGKEVTPYTELKSAVHSAYTKYEMNEGITNIMSKTPEIELSWGKNNIKDLIRELQWILDPPVFDENNLVEPKS